MKKTNLYALLLFVIPFYGLMSVFMGIKAGLLFMVGTVVAMIWIATIVSLLSEGSWKFWRI